MYIEYTLNTIVQRVRGVKVVVLLQYTEGYTRAITTYNVFCVSSGTNNRELHYPTMQHYSGIIYHTCVIFICNTACCCFLYELSWRANGKFCHGLLHSQDPNTVPLWYGCMVQVLLHNTPDYSFMFTIISIKCKVLS